jgi:hypothetical protein
VEATKLDDPRVVGLVVPGGVDPRHRPTEMRVTSASGIAPSRFARA